MEPGKKIAKGLKLANCTGLSIVSSVEVSTDLDV